MVHVSHAKKGFLFVVQRALMIYSLPVMVKTIFAKEEHFSQDRRIFGSRSRMCVHSRMQTVSCVWMSSDVHPLKPTQHTTISKQISMFSSL